jgi:hypothetical protein
MRRLQRSMQAPASVIMVRPHHFTVNTETAADNVFQQMGSDSYGQKDAAYREITQAIDTLRDCGVEVHVFEDESTETPDSVFPNNWFSTHAGGHIAIYPMKAASRRRERRWDIIEMLKRDYRVQDVIDYSGLEADGLFLEGTGAMVLDHIDRVAYAVKSDRTNPIALERFCTHFNFEPMAFDAHDEHGVPIYHTNVLMCIATDCALVGLSLIDDATRRDEIASRLQDSGREIIDLSSEQIASFAGNAIELQGRNERILALSRTAFKALTTEQMAVVERSCRLVPLEIPTIERAGGSVRCTIAGIHLSRRVTSSLPSAAARSTKTPDATNANV